MSAFTDYLKSKKSSLLESINLDAKKNKFFLLPIEKQISAVNHFFKEQKYSALIQKVGSKFIIDDADNMGAFGLAKYDEDGNYITEYSSKIAKEYIKKITDNEEFDF